MSKKDNNFFRHDLYFAVFKAGADISEANCQELLHKGIFRDDMLLARTYKRGEPVKAGKTKKANCIMGSTCR